MSYYMSLNQIESDSKSYLFLLLREPTLVILATSIHLSKATGEFRILLDDWKMREDLSGSVKHDYDDMLIIQTHFFFFLKKKLVLIQEGHIFVRYIGVLHNGGGWDSSIPVTQVLNIVPNRLFFNLHPPPILSPFGVPRVYYLLLYAHIYIYIHYLTPVYKWEYEIFHFLLLS